MINLLANKKKLLIIIIAISIILGLTLTILFYVNYVNKDDGQDNTGSEEYIPKESELGNYLLFEDRATLNLKYTKDLQRTPAIMININLKYFKEVKGIDNVAQKLENNRAEMKEQVSTYFLGITNSEAREIHTREKAKKDLKKIINEVLLKNEDISKDEETEEKKEPEIVYNVIISEWFIP